MINNLKLFDFQTDAVNFLLDNTRDSSGKKTILLKSPTGSGKTIILLSYIKEYFQIINNEVVFIWLTPGKGDLEEQSRNKMRSFLPGLRTGDIFDILQLGFSGGSTYFVNWEMITNKKNTALQESERKNLFERISEAHNDQLKFIVIIDEEHLNNTSKANDILNALNHVKEIRVSATTMKNSSATFYEIGEEDVINSGLITKALYINEGVANIELTDIDSEASYLIKLANEKRKEILQAYIENSLSINPLVIIQFPDMSNTLIEHVENMLSSMGYTYENRMVSKWLSEEKINIDNIEFDNAEPIFLLMKQAISTGWDNPRAKILIKLRENMTETFEIQTLGRIRRMPEAKHYSNEILNYCYLYTFDEKYKETVIQAGNSYEVIRLFLKKEFENIEFIKETRNKEYQYVNEKDVLEKAFEFYKNKFNLTNNKKKNKEILENYGYVFGETITGRFRSGKFTKFSDLAKSEKGDYGKLSYEVNTSKNGFEVLSVVDNIKRIIGIPTNKTRALLQHLFNSQIKSKYKIISLTNKEWYAFIINNSDKLKEDFSILVSKPSEIQMEFLPKKTDIFKFPKEDFFRFSSYEKNVSNMNKNIYNNYNTSMLLSNFRSTSEQLFEHYLENNDNVSWYYKNGDTGSQYLSIIYGTNINREFLFYPDYVVGLMTDEIWIIETKGGEVDGQSKNIDIQAENKFNAFREYGNRYSIKWGFVRDRNSKLYLNNSIYTEEMNNENWRPIEEFLNE